VPKGALLSKEESQASFVNLNEAVSDVISVDEHERCSETFQSTLNPFWLSDEYLGSHSTVPTGA
jgi:hypothetical protein